MGHLNVRDKDVELEEASLSGAIQIITKPEMKSLQLHIVTGSAMYSFNTKTYYVSLWRDREECAKYCSDRLQTAEFRDTGGLLGSQLDGDTQNLLKFAGAPSYCPNVDSCLAIAGGNSHLE